MKKLISSLFILGLLVAVNVQARVLTVSNVPGSLAMFSSVQVAIDSAKVGDTVFVHASATEYAFITVKKRIVLLGEGGYPNFEGVSSAINGVAVDTLAGLPVSGFIIMGFKIRTTSGNLAFTINNNIRGLVIKNNFIGSEYSSLYYPEYGPIFAGSGHIIVNNIISNRITIGSNIVLSNNIFLNSLTSGTNCTIANNIFLSDGVSSLNNCTVVNNIFVKTGNAISGGVGNSYSKNIQAGTDLPSGNFTNVQPVNVFSESTISSSMTQILTSTWKQLTTSVGKNSGTDGKDVGVYGGNFPFPSNKVFNGDPGLPKIQLVEIQNAVLEPNGTLKVNFKAKSANAK